MKERAAGGRTHTLEDRFLGEVLSVRKKLDDKDVYRGSVVLTTSQS